MVEKIVIIQKSKVVMEKEMMDKEIINQLETVSTNMYRGLRSPVFRRVNNKPKTPRPQTMAADSAKARELGAPEGSPNKSSAGSVMNMLSSTNMALIIKTTGVRFLKVCARISL